MLALACIMTVAFWMLPFGLVAYSYEFSPTW